jgi:hypothetical protein
MRGLLGMALAALLPACAGAPAEAGPGGNVAPGGDGAVFRTDSAAYTLVSTPMGLEARVAYVFTNPTDGPAHFVNCRGQTGLRLEKAVGGGWVRAWSPALLACLSPPIVVGPGERYEGVVHVLAPDPAGNVYPKFEVDEVPGTYRIVWEQVLRSYDDRQHPFGEPLPLPLRISNPFELRAPRR